MNIFHQIKVTLDYDIEEIDALLKKGEVHFDWYLSSEDRRNPIIRATLNLDLVERGEGSSPEGEPLEKEGDGSSKGSNLAAVDKIRMNNQRIRTIRNEIDVVRKELQDLRKLRKFGYVDNQGGEGEGKEDCVAEKVPVADEDCAPAEVSGEAADQTFGQANEAACDEAAGEASEAAAVEGAVNEGPRNEEAADEGPANEGPSNEAAANEAAHEVNEEAAHEKEADADEEGSTNASGRLIHIGDDDDGGEVEPNIVVPMPSYNGDPRTTVNFDMLYNTVTRRDLEKRYVSEIMGQLLTTAECHSLGRRECVDNMTLMFAATIIMYFEKRSFGVIKRMVFSPNFATHALIDYKRKLSNQHVWQLHDYQTYFRNELVKVEDLLSADWVFILIVNSEHWWCYALKVSTFQLFVIDSLEKGIQGRCRIDRTIAQNIQRLWGLLTNQLEDSKIPLLVQPAKIPVQPNTYDCGVIVLKAIEIWDGEDKFDGKSMPDYTNEELAGFRQKFIWDWIMDEDNVRRIETLHQLGLI